MKWLRMTALAASLAAFPAAAHAQTAHALADNAHPQGADRAQHENSASPAGEGRADPSAMPRRQMRDGMYVEDRCCPCCEKMMQQAGGMTHPGERGTAAPSPEQPEDHQH